MNVAAAEQTRRNILDVESVRADFPILSLRVYDDRPLVYLDSGASAQKPRVVIDGMKEFLETEYSNIHRGLHYLSQTATERYEDVRRIVAEFINARHEQEIVFVRNFTEAVNLIATSYGRTNFEAGDEVVITEMEHHANIVPWQMLETEIGINLKVVPVDDSGNFLMDAFEDALGPRVRLVAVTHTSNVLGTITPVREIVAKAHEQGIPVLLDGAQGIVHSTVDVQELDVDFYAFTGHKLYGPSGVGVLYGKLDLLEKMPPYQGGGDMIERVSFSGTTFREPPHRFEAGTPAIAEVVGLGKAIEYVRSIGMEAIRSHEHDLLVYATDKLKSVEGLRIIGEARDKAALISFVMDSAHAHDVGTIVDRMGVAIRVGHHCAEPLHERFGLAATARASFAMYNTREEVDALTDALHMVNKMFA